MNCCECLSRSGLTIINILFFAIGGGLVFLGSFMIAQYSHLSNGGVSALHMALLPAIILIVAGIMTAILAIIGCVAACNEAKCATGLYFTVLLILLLGLITGGILGFVYRKRIDSQLHDIMKSGLDKYGANKDVTAEVDLIQKEFKCCGVDNTTDWLATAWYKNQTSSTRYPQSCCAPKGCTYSSHDKNLYDRGCYTLVKEKFKKYLMVVGSVAGGFAVVLVIGMVFSCVLLVQKRRRAQEVPYIGLPSDHYGTRTHPPPSSGFDGIRI